jgi:site-specific recombinase XerD
MLRAVVKRGAPTIANDVLRWVRRMFDYAIKRHLVRFNPAAAFDLADAGGKELARERALSRDELVTLFEAMRQAKGFSVQNELTVKLLLLLAVRKGELIAARWDEFELEADPPVWHLPGIRTKTGQPLDIPLPTMAVEWLQKLKELACNSTYVLPARKLQTRMVPHVCESTLGVAMGKVKHGLPHFTVHDFRRTARTYLAALGVEPHVAERCLNHKLKGGRCLQPARLLRGEAAGAGGVGAIAAEAGTSTATDKAVGGGTPAGTERRGSLTTIDSRRDHVRHEQQHHELCPPRGLARVRRPAGTVRSVRKHQRVPA